MVRVEYLLITYNVLPVRQIVILQDRVLSRCYTPTITNILHTRALTELQKKM